MNRIIFIYNATTGDWLIKNNFTSQSEATAFILDNEAFSDYLVQSLNVQGDSWGRQRQTIQSLVTRLSEQAIRDTALEAMATKAVEDTVASQEALAEGVDILVKDIVEADKAKGVSSTDNSAAAIEAQATKISALEQAATKIKGAPAAFPTKSTK